VYKPEGDKGIKQLLLFELLCKVSLIFDANLVKHNLVIVNEAILLAKLASIHELLASIILLQPDHLILKLNYRVNKCKELICLPLTKQCILQNDFCSLKAAHVDELTEHQDKVGESLATGTIL
jgi:hypothetical protein